MKTVSVLIVVDALNALAHGLPQNVYMVDSNKHFGSGGEGGKELLTAVHDGQTIRWHIVGVSPENDVEIAGFTGQMVDGKFSNPKKDKIEGQVFWEGRVESQGETGTVQYSVDVSVDGKIMTFDPHLEIKA